MPYINVNTAKKMTPAQTQELKKGLGEIISILPGKSEQVLMVGIEDGKTIFFSGEEQENCAYVDVKIYGTADFEVKAEFTRAVFGVFEGVLGVQQDKLFLSISEFATWGTKGNLK